MALTYSKVSIVLVEKMVLDGSSLEELAPQSHIYRLEDQKILEMSTQLGSILDNLT